MPPRLGQPFQWAAAVFAEASENFRAFPSKGNAARLRDAAVEMAIVEMRKRIYG